MANSHASSNVIAFPQPCRERTAHAGGLQGPVRPGGFVGTIASRLSEAGQVRFGGTAQRPTLPDGSVSPLY